MTVTRHNQKATKKLSQAQKATALGVTREHLNRVLRGKRISHSLLAKHKAAFGHESQTA